MKIIDFFRQLYFKADAKIRGKRKILVCLYLMIVILLSAWSYYVCRNEFSWNEIQCMSQVKILLTDSDFSHSNSLSVSFYNEDVGKFQVFSASVADTENHKIYPAKIGYPGTIYKVSFSADDAYELGNFVEEGFVEYDAVEAMSNVYFRNKSGNADIETLRRLTLESVNTVITPVGEGRYLVFESSSSPVKKTLHDLTVWHFIFLIAYVLFRYVRWARKTILSEREQVRVIRRDMMNAIAHEIRTPLAAIMGYTENLKLGIREDKKDWYLDRITEKGEQIDHMIDDILSLAKLDEKEALQKEKMSVNEIVNELLSEYPDVRFETEEKAEWFITGDPGYVSRMFRCLIDNSVKYRKEDTPVHVYIDTNEVRIHNICDPLDEDIVKDLYSFHTSKDGRYSYGLYFSKKAAEKNGLKLRIYNDRDGVTALIM